MGAVAPLIVGFQMFQSGYFTAGDTNNVPQPKSITVVPPPVIKSIAPDPVKPALNESMKEEPVVVGVGDSNTSTTPTAPVDTDTAGLAGPAPDTTDFTGSEPLPPPAPEQPAPTQP